jgi:hypothetical protein
LAFSTGAAPSSSASATGGNGGATASDTGGHGGDASASSDSIAYTGVGATADATAAGGIGGTLVYTGCASCTAEITGGDGGSATATASATSRGGAATSTATAAGGAGGAGYGGSNGATGAANATASAATIKGAPAEAQATAIGSSGLAQATAQSGFGFVRAQPVATAQIGGTATANAIADGGGDGQPFANPGETAFALASALPDSAYASALTGGATHVAAALLGPRDLVMGTAILGGNYAPDGDGDSRTYQASATFGIGYHGDLILGLIDDQANGFAGGLGFQSLTFTIAEDGVTVFEATFGSLPSAESFFRDAVFDLGPYSGQDVTFGYSLAADGVGGFAFDLATGGAVPETPTWAMLGVGFLGLGALALRRRTPACAM